MRSDHSSRHRDRNQRFWAEAPEFGGRQAGTQLPTWVERVFELAAVMPLTDKTFRKG